MTLEEVVEVMKRAHQQKKMTVRLHTGDPSIYGAVREQMDILEQEGIPYESCPGVSSFCGAAAALNLEYTLPDVSQSVIITRMAGRTPVPEREEIRRLCGTPCYHGDIFKYRHVTGTSGSVWQQEAHEADTPAAIVYKATWQEEEKYICTVSTLAQTAQEHNITKTALIIVGDVVTHSNYRTE